MIYHYKCTNSSCKLCEEVSINFSMSQAGEIQHCEKCEETLQKIFGGPAIRTSDGYKG